MLNRVNPPAFQNVKSFNLKEVKRLKLDNNRNVYYLNHGDQPVFKLEFSIKAGSWYSEKYDLFPLVLKMLNESTRKRSSSQMAVAIDTLGAFIEFNPGFDSSSISIYGLTKHFNEISSLISEILKEPKFSESEFDILKSKEIQRLKLNEEKNSYLSSIELRKLIFGIDHPYGKSSTLNGIQLIENDKVKSFFNSNYDDFDIFISGLLPNEFEQQLNKVFGFDSIQHVTERSHPLKQPFDKGSNIIRPKSIQSSIKIGKPLFRRNHPDYIKLLVTNELLGGFFGSRLMKNIREEKGLTYGIYSHLYSLNNEGYFCISTDVKGDFTQRVIEEIFKEIKTLQNSDVTIDELETVKNYMLGSFAASISSPFALMDKFKAIHLQGLDYTYYKNYFESISKITPEDIQLQSQKYFKLDTLIICSVGPSN